MIKLKDITVKINDVYILKDFNLSVERGEKVLISGKSGIGKSTLLKLILGFTFPDKGCITFDNIELDKKSIWEIRKRIAYVSQDLDIGQGEVNALIEEIFFLKTNLKSSFNNNELIKLLHLFELKEDILFKDYEELSGGEKQRIAIIISILLKREVFLLDEITSALDESLKQKVLNYFLDQKNLTVIIISHDTDYKQNNKLRKINLEAQK